MPFKLPVSMEVSTHSRLKAAGDGSMTPAVRLDIVSTHSRLKAAGVVLSSPTTCNLCFNTQPPEGGWDYNIHQSKQRDCFNTQPPEGGWNDYGCLRQPCTVSTHSRLKAAGQRACNSLPSLLRFNTQPPEGGWYQQA